MNRIIPVTSRRRKARGAIFLGMALLLCLSLLLTACEGGTAGPTPTPAQVPYPPPHVAPTATPGPYPPPPTQMPEQPYPGPTPTPAS